MNVAYKTRHILFFVTVACVVSWGIWFLSFAIHPDIQSIQDERMYWYLFFGSFGPTVAAILTSGLYFGRPELADLLKRLIKVKVNWRVYLFVFTVLPAAGIATLLVSGVRPTIPLWQILLTMIPLAPLNALLGGIVFGIGPLGEEMGWRGLLGNQIRKRTNEYVGAVVVGIIWTLWHAPLFRFADFRVGLSIPVFLPLYTVSLILVAYTMGHLWRWSNGSLFIAVFFHAMVNITTSRLVEPDWWAYGDIGPVQLYSLIIIGFALTALCAKIVNTRNTR